MTQMADITRNDLYSLGFEFNRPFQLTLSDHSLLHCDQIIRIIPHKRLVSFGTWNSKSVVAKLFYSLRAKEHFEQELKGVQSLSKNNIPTPVLYFHDTTLDKRIYVLLFERIFKAESAEFLLREGEFIPQRDAIIIHLITELATQHALGILQKDLHLKNFLVHSAGVYSIDGGEIKTYAHPLPKKESMHSLALLLSQLGVGLDDKQERFFQFYAKLRGWIVKEEDIRNIVHMIKQWRQSRWQRYRKKIFRRCTQFACFKHKHLSGMFDRSYESLDLHKVLTHPDSFFSHPDTVKKKNPDE